MTTGKTFFPNTLVRECYAAFVFYHGFVFTAFITTFPATLVPQLKDEGYRLDTVTESILSSMALLVNGICTFFVPIIISTAGRIIILRVSILICGFGMCVVAFSSNIFLICCGIIITASASSIQLPITSCYVSEVCRKEQRGVLLSGALVVGYIAAAVIYILHGILSWRIIASLTIAVAFCGFLQTFCVPESKYWHVLKNEDEKAKKSLKWFQPTLNDTELDETISKMKQSTDERFCAANRSSYLQFLQKIRKKSIRNPLLKGIALFTMRSGAGRPVFCVFFVTVLRDLRLPYDLKTITTIFGIVEVVSAFAILYTISKLKRKTAIYLCSLVMIVFMTTMVAYRVSLNFGVFLPAIIPLIGIYACATVLLIGYNSLVFVIVSEIQSAAYRAEANSFTIAIGFFTFSFYTFVYPHARLVIPIEYIVLFFICNTVVAMLFVYLFFPETSKFEFYDDENTKSASCTTIKR